MHFEAAIRPMLEKLRNTRDHADATTRSLIDELSRATDHDRDDAIFELRFLVQHVLTPPNPNGIVPKDFDRPPAPSANGLAAIIATLIPSQLAHLRALIRARVHDYTPLQYLLGSVPFAPDLDLLVEPPILIPRWETEEWALRVADAWSPHSPQIIEDWCTGSGCIALLLKSHFGRTTRVTGFDLSPAAIDLARRNAERNALNAKFHVADVLKDLPLIPGVDLVVANPPYIAASEFARLDPGVRDWEDQLALVGRGESGAEDYRRLVEVAHARLSSTWRDVRVPRIALEIGHDQGEVVKRMVEAWFDEVEVWQDLAGKDRCVVGYHRKPDAKK
ncbi:hypothetical protein GGF32_005719 [Allomyces javanicus]|nr:hypothetical protein GGF32_005719 [Allomyces javanicus]